MTARITVAPLDPAPFAALCELYEETSDAESRTRYQMILLAQQGYKVPQIAQIVLRSEDTVARVLKRFLTGGLDAVPRRTPPGRERTVTLAWEAELLHVIEADPARQSDRTLLTGPLSGLRYTWASRPAFTSPKRRFACTYTPMITSANVPPGPSGVKPKRKRITRETPAGRGSFSRDDPPRTSTHS